MIEQKGSQVGWGNSGEVRRGFPPSRGATGRQAAVYKSKITKGPGFVKKPGLILWVDGGFRARFD